MPPELVLRIVAAHFRLNPSELLHYIPSRRDETYPARYVAARILVEWYCWPKNTAGAALRLCPHERGKGRVASWWRREYLEDVYQEVAARVRLERSLWLDAYPLSQ